MGETTSEPPGRLAHQLFTTGGSPWLHTNCLLPKKELYAVTVLVTKTMRTLSSSLHLGENQLRKVVENDINRLSSVITARA